VGIDRRVLVIVTPGVLVEGGCQGQEVLELGLDDGRRADELQEAGPAGRHLDETDQAIGFAHLVAAHPGEGPREVHEAGLAAEERSALESGDLLGRGLRQRHLLAPAVHVRHESAAVSREDREIALGLPVLADPEVGLAQGAGRELAPTGGGGPVQVDAPRRGRITAHRRGGRKAEAEALPGRRIPGEASVGGCIGARSSDRPHP